MCVRSILQQRHKGEAQKCKDELKLKEEFWGGMHLGRGSDSGRGRGGRGGFRSRGRGRGSGRGIRNGSGSHCAHASHND